MANKHTERCSIHIMSRQKCKLKPKELPTLMVKINKLTTPDIGKDTKQLKLSNIVDDSEKWYNYFGKRSASCL